MPNDGETTRDLELKKAIEHSRRITKWLLDGRPASERERLIEEEKTTKREAA